MSGTRSLKAILQVGDRLDTVAQRPLGQELEIVPQQHPSGAPSTLFVQVLFRGKPLGGRALTCANRRHGAIVTRTVRTDGNGMASCALGQGGEWMLSLVHMEPSREPGADWRSFWTSLTFALPETAKR